MYFSLIFFLILIIPAIVMPKYIMMKTQSPYRVVMRSTLIISAAAVIIFMFASLAGQSVFAQLQNMVQDVSKQAANNSQIIQMFADSAATEEERIDLLVQLYNAVLQQVPACIMFLGAVVSYLEYIVISKFLAKRRKTTVIGMSRFREFSFPSGAAVAIMLMYLAAWLMAESDMPSAGMLYVNIDLLFDLAFSLQGISVVLMFFHLKKAPRAVGIVVAIILWVTYFGRLFLVMLGIFDMFLGIKSKIRGGTPKRGL